MNTEILMNNAKIIRRNEAMNALVELQKAMEGEAERAGLYTEDDVVALVKEVRAELEAERAERQAEESELKSDDDIAEYIMKIRRNEH